MLQGSVEYKYSFLHDKGKRIIIRYIIIQGLVGTCQLLLGANIVYCTPQV